MKKTITFLFTLLTIQAFAADLVVRDGGAGNSYATITSAINDAVDGDRIIIRPKVGDVPYIENLTIDKSLTFVSEINGDNYEINGSITINVDVNRTVNIFNAFTTGDITLGGVVSGGRAFVNITDSLSNGSLLLAQDNVTVNVVRTSCNEITFRHGKVIANTCRRIYLENDAGDSLSADEVYIIANNINDLPNNVQQPPVLNINSLNYIFNVFNNRIFNSFGTGIIITGIKEGTTNLILNNFISPSFGNFTIGVHVDALALATIVIRNNLFEPAGSEIEVNSSSNAYIIAQYNMIGTNTFDTFNVDVEENNIVNASYDTVTYIGENQNAGHPDAIYTDIDLTQNDIGPKGGSYTQDNYFTGDNTTPYVFFLKTPRRIFNGTSTFEAVGSAKSN